MLLMGRTDEKRNRSLAQSHSALRIVVHVKAQPIRMQSRRGRSPCVTSGSGCESRIESGLFTPKQIRDRV